MTGSASVRVGITACRVTTRNTATMPRRRVIGNLVGIAIGLVGLGFVVVRLASDWPAVTDSLGDADWWLLVYALLVGLVGMTIIGLNWRVILRDLGASTGSVRSNLHQYFVGQLGKYVPGGIWPVVGRAEMAHRGGTNRAAAYAGTLLSLAATYLAALLTAALFAASALVRGERIGWWGWLLLVVPVGLMALHPRVLTWGVQLMSRLAGREISLQVPTWSKSVWMVSRHIPAWLAISFATFLVSAALEGGATFDQVGVATCVSWFLGFVVIGLPGGIGVREAVFVSLIGSAVGDSVGATVALLARIVFIAVDLVGAGVSTGVHWSTSSETPRSDRG